jgi:hypothetical protein
LQIRSISFDTSFLLKDNLNTKKITDLLSKDHINCYISTIVLSELEQLKIWGRITSLDYKQALQKITHTHAKIIDFKNRLLSDTFGKSCVKSMQEHHGVKPEDIKNDCNILITTLKNGIDIFLSEDFHFTSKITKEVISEVKNAACTDFHQMCNSHLYAIDSKTFLQAYNHGDIDLKIIQSHIKNIKKDRKRL